jgi:hypothetical protein
LAVFLVGIWVSSEVSGVRERVFGCFSFSFGFALRENGASYLVSLSFDGVELGGFGLSRSRWTNVTEALLPLLRLIQLGRRKEIPEVEVKRRVARRSKGVAGRDLLVPVALQKLQVLLQTGNWEVDCEKALNPFQPVPPSVPLLAYASNPGTDEVWLYGWIAACDSREG